MVGLKEIYTISKSRFILMATMVLLILACETPSNNHLFPETKANQFSNKYEPSDSDTIVAKVASTIEPPTRNDHVVGNKLFGVYVSEITSDVQWFSAKRHKNMVLTLKQNGDNFSATDKKHGMVITGSRIGNVVNFRVDKSDSFHFLDAYGQWTMSADGSSLKGTWRRNGHDSYGKWNLRRIEDNGVELYEIESGVNRPFKIRESEKLFDIIFASPSNQNIVFYIHGRGQDFEANFDSARIPAVEKYSNTRFVIIRWLSWGDSSTRPYQQAINSASGVSKFLFAFNDYKSRKPDKVGNRKITLLAHSMGNIPLKIFLEESYEKKGLQKDLFNSVVLSSADVPRITHRKWVEKIDFADDVYIIQHRGDMVLYLSEFFFRDDTEARGPKLGVGFEIGVKSENLASNAYYLDLTHLGNSIHRHFNIPSNPEATRLFKLLLNGQGFDFPDPTIGLTERSDQSPIFYFYTEKRGTER